MCKVGTTFSFLKRIVFCHNRWHVLHLLQNTLRFTIETIVYVFEMLIFQPGNTCFFKNYAVTIGKQSLSQSMHHTHCFSVSNPVILFSIIEYIFSILERSLSDPWAILERNTHKHNENASFLPQGSLKDRSRIAQGSISMVSRIDFERTLVYTN